jgi:K+-transporting ATPase KdpF subunit
VTFVELAGLVLVLALGVYLLIALLRPERFQ